MLINLLKTLNILSLSLPIFLFFSLVKLTIQHKHHDVPPRLIVISFDGFRWDYLDLTKKANRTTPNFEKLIQSGVTILNDGVKNVFITKTFPNHYSLATGVYEENHGIVANSFFDPLFNETFDMSLPGAKDSKWWDGQSGGQLVEPIWLTNQRCGCVDVCECDRSSGVVFWPGSDVDTLRPNHVLVYNESLPFEQRINILLEWFLDEEEPINFGMLYFDEPDKTGHHFGPDSPEIISKVVELDNLLGYFLASLERLKLLKEMNIIITSDHGMAPQMQVIYLNDFIDASLIHYYGTSPVFNIQPLIGHEEEVYNKLKEIPHLIVYKKEHIPDNYHYKNNRRILPIVLTAEEGYRICLSRDDTYCATLKGDHGYNNSLKSMHPIFVAFGPAFKSNYRVEQPFEIVDLYSLMCYILHITPHANDGDFTRVQSILIVKGEVQLGGNLLFIAMMLLLILTSLVYSVCVCYHHCHYFVGDSTELGKYATLGTAGLVTAGNDGVVVGAGGGASLEGRKHLLGPEEDEDDLV